MPTRVKWATLDETLLNEIIQRIVKEIDPEKIIMFGSRAKGTATENSDLDLMVVADSERPRHERSAPLYGSLSDILLPMDILVFTPEEVYDWSNVRQYISTTAVREGKVIYAKSN
jgi:predicted nucleotidyltransferase